MERDSPEPKRQKVDHHDQGQHGRTRREGDSGLATQYVQPLDFSAYLARALDQIPGDDISQSGAARTGMDEDYQSPPVPARWAEELRRVPTRRRIVHDVIPVGSLGEAESLYQTLSRSFEDPRSGFAFTAVSFHLDGCRKPHVHVVHDCAWSNGSCRCVAFYGIHRRPNRASIWTSNATGWDYWRLVVYLATNPRRLKHFAVAGADWREYLGAAPVEHRGHTGCGSSRTVETLLGAFPSTSACEDCSRSTGGDQDAVSLRPGTSTAGQTRRRQNAHTEESLYRVIIRNPVSPLNSIIRTPVWLDSPDLRFIQLDDKRLQRAIQVLNEQLCNWTTLDYIQLYSTTNPLFDAPHGNISAYYMDVSASYDAMVRLLEYQLGEEVQEFVHDLYNLLERRVPMKNCMEVVSPPSAGKNFFFDAVVSFYINRGTIHNFNRYSNFPLQDAVGKRVLIWNEPNCESAAYETIKKIFGGDVDNVAVKYSPDMIVTRTPVIVLSNNETFPRDEAFNHRMFRYKWRSCPALKQYDKKIHPLALISLFDNYLDDQEYKLQRNLK
ncbi:uncharacterized protein LOC115312284 [Ixodes scapularis]|uniref:uncharacterized protein LOC115312284 n=1 Tax=Ixodes scapularis TaxID=6945 RepID=UPI001C3949A8|nr:uncharacterized protein LOC115312284 [Ixodes scapularis]